MFLKIVVNRALFPHRCNRTMIIMPASLIKAGVRIFTSLKTWDSKIYLRLSPCYYVRVPQRHKFKFYVLERTINQRIHALNNLEYEWCGPARRPLHRDRFMIYCASHLPYSASSPLPLTKYSMLHNAI
jgi:hypothetical protein